MTGSFEDILKNNIAGNAKTPYCLASCLSSIFTNFIPALSASSSMCSISTNTLPHCLQSLLSKHTRAIAFDMLESLVFLNNNRTYFAGFLISPFSHCINPKCGQPSNNFLFSSKNITKPFCIPHSLDIFMPKFMQTF